MNSDTNKKWQPTEAQRALLERLREEVAKAESATQFARDYLTFGASKLSKILNAIDPAAPSSYFDEVTDPDAVLREVEEGLAGMEQTRTLRDRMLEAQILRLRHFEAVAQAVKECRTKSGPERLIKYLAPTGGSKSMCCLWLAQRHGASVVEARQIWRHAERGYAHFLLDTARALRVRVGSERNPADLERAITVASRSRAMTLAIDEAEFFNARVLNGIRYLLNATNLVIVLCAIRQAHDRWDQWYSVEADQLARRTHAVIEVRQLKPADVAPFFTRHKFKREELALEGIATAANAFGCYSTVARIAEALDLGPSSLGDVNGAIRRASAQLGRVLPEIEPPKKEAQP